MIYFQKMLYDGDGRKNPKYKNENKEKIPRLVTLPSSRLQNGGRLKSKVGDRSQGRPEGSLFNSDYT